VTFERDSQWHQKESQNLLRLAISSSYQYWRLCVLAKKKTEVRQVEHWDEPSEGIKNVIKQHESTKNKIVFSQT
jgi:hypothetical protein